MRILSKVLVVFAILLAGCAPDRDADFAQAALDAGALGYVVKARLASDLLPAIRAALADRRFISPTISLGENA